MHTNGDRNNRFTHFGPARFLLLLATCTWAASASPSNKWRIEVSGSARTTGVIELSVAPKDAAPTTLAVGIPPRTSENRIAHLLRDALVAKFGKSVYHVEVDDGEDVLVKAKGSTPQFDVVVVRNTVDGVRLNVGKE